MSGPASAQQRTALGIAAGALAATALLSVAVWKAGVQVMGALVLVPLAGLLVKRPALATGLGVGLLYTNLPVTAAERGLVPVAAAAVVPLLFVPALGHHLFVRRGGVRVDRTFGLMVLFLVVLVVSAFAAVGPGAAMSRIGVYASEGLVVYLLVLNAVRDPGELRVAIRAVLAASCLLASLTVYQAVTGDYDQTFLGLAQRSVEHIDDRGYALDQMGLADRSRGPVDDPNRYAQVLLMAAPLAAVLALNATTAARRMRYAGAAAVLLAGVLITYSRGAFLTVVVLCVIAGALRVVRPSRIFPLMAAGALLVPVLVPGYADRIRSILGAVGLFADDVQVEVEADGATRGRTTEMLAALIAYKEHPFLGVGPGQYVDYYSVEYMTRPGISFRDLPTPRRAHNLYLELAAETGTAGLLVFMAIPGLLLADLWSLRKRFLRARPDLARMAAAFGLVILSYLGTGVFLHLAFERYYWFVIGLTASAVAILAQLHDQGVLSAPARTVQMRAG